MRIHGPAQPFQTNHALSPFPEYCRMSRLFARIADVVNDATHRSRETQPPSRAEFAQAGMGFTPLHQSSSPRGSQSANNGHRSSMSTGSDGKSAGEDHGDDASSLMLLEAQMTHIMGSLSSHLRFSADTLKRHVENKTACMLLHLHLWVSIVQGSLKCAPEARLIHHSIFSVPFDAHPPTSTASDPP